MLVLILFVCNPFKMDLIGLGLKIIMFTVNIYDSLKLNTYCLMLSVLCINIYVILITRT